LKTWHTIVVEAKDVTNRKQEVKILTNVVRYVNGKKWRWECKKMWLVMNGCFLMFSEHLWEHIMSLMEAHLELDGNKWNTLGTTPPHHPQLSILGACCISSFVEQNF
jgi:hypothetical protein